jgi:hypothetical protein
MDKQLKRKGMTRKVLWEEYRKNYPDVYTYGRFIQLFSSLKMYHKCSECGLKYEKELGFFQGAMYVSYALQVGLFVVIFAIDALLINMNINILVAIIVSSIIVLFPVTLRWSRLLWMNFFFHYDKDLASHLNAH